MTRILLVIVAAALLAAGSIWLHEQSQPTVYPSQPLRASNTGVRSIHAPGIVEGAERQRDLRLQVAGRVEKVFVGEGQYVEAGQVLLKLDDATQRHQVALLKADLDYAEAQLARLRNGAHEQERHEARAIYDARVVRLDHAEREWGRAQRLMESKAIGEQDVTRWEAEFRALSAEVRAAKARLDFLTAPAREDEVSAAQARVETARARLLLAQTELERTQLTAPAAGQVLELNREPGELVDLIDQQPAVILANTRRLRVRAYVEELDATQVEPGMAARITADGLPGRVFTGKVTEVLPRMSFKQVWTDRPDERFDGKTREVVIEVYHDQGDLPLLPTHWSANEPPAPVFTAERVATGTSPVDVAPQGGAKLVFGLMVEVELLPPEQDTDQQAAKLNR